MAAGDFSASALLQIKLKAESMWTDSRLSADFKANADAAVAVKTNSTARFEQLKDREKDNTVAVTWLNPCAIAVRDCETDCDLNGDQIESGKKEYEPTLCKEVAFSVDAETMRTNNYTVEDAAARALAYAVKALDEWWAQQVLVKLKSFSGINAHAEPYTWAAGTTTVPAANYGVDMIPEIMFDSMVNKMNAPYYINNGDLWVPWTKIQQDAGNSDGKGDMERIKALRLYFDIWNFGPAGITEDLFAVSSSAVAYVTTNRHGDAPELIGGTVQQTRYTVPSSVIPGVKYDAFYSLKCLTVAGKSRIFHTWKLKTTGDLFLNPEGCTINVGGTDYNPTGVLSYSKGA